MKVTIKLNAYDMMKLANPETEAEVIAQAHNLETVIFNDRENMMTATMTLEDKRE